MKELKQVGAVHFYVPSDASRIFEIVSGICNSLGQYVSAVRCERNFGDLEFKYSPGASHYSVKCSFNEHHLLLMDVYRPSSHIKFSGIGIFDYSQYTLSLYEEQQISILHNKILKNIQSTFTSINRKNNGDV